MSDEQQRPPTAPGAPGGGSPMGDTPVSSSDAGMANIVPPALPGTPAPAPPPAPTPIGTRPSAAGMGGVRGVTPPGSAGQIAAVGQDIRHRGWYWHWNTLITQYAPLLGLKGIGLLNSYTVWTDRREGSPHQGYAFPTQDAEGKFYGEGREELITLNKVLVALDLIEIHKEMVLRQDDRNRRWRVPHNFYRVKDPRDGLVLNLPAVVRVLELAQRDRNVFRHIKHIFSPHFAPIDRTSIWHYLLPELRQMPIWQQLAERAERERRGAKKLLALPTESSPASVATIDAVNDIAPESTDRAIEPSVVHEHDVALHTDNDARGDAGFTARTDDVAPIDAEQRVTTSDVAPSDAVVHSTGNEGMTRIESASSPFVAPRHSTEHQRRETQEETSSSTSSTSARESVSDLFGALAEGYRLARYGEIAPAPDETAGEPLAPEFDLSGQPLPPVPELPEEGAVIVRALDVSDPSPNLIAQQTATIADIEAALTMANGRPPSDMEISLLVQVARECDPAAHAQGYGPGTGLGWVLAAIWEAVNSGSQFVAPKRIAAICDRWAVEGFGSDHRANANAPPSYTPPPTWPMSSLSPEPTYTNPPPVTITDSAPLPTLPDIGYTSVPPAATPGTITTETEARRLWEQVVRRLEGVLHPDALDRWFGEGRVTAIEHDRVIVTVPGADVALKLASYRGLISRRMSETLGRTVDVVFQATQISSSSAASMSGVQQSTRVYPDLSQSEAPSPWSWPAPTSSGSFPAVPLETTPRPASERPSPPLEPREAAPSLTREGEGPAGETSSASEPPIIPPTVPTVPVTPGGLTNRQIWATALRDLQARMSGATFAVWIKPAELLSVDPDGTLVIGARNRVQRERLENQHLADLTAVLGKILDRPVGIRVVVIGEADARVG